MKYLGLILVVAFAVGQLLAQSINENDSQLDLSKDSQAKASYSDKFHNLLEKLKIILREGNETLGIPKLDPFALDLLELQPNDELIKGDVTLANLKVEGISDYRIDAAIIPVLPAKITIGLTWPRIHATGLHKFAVVALEQEVEAFGDGEFTFTLTDVSFHSVISIKFTGNVKVKKMDTKLSLGALALSATGIFNDEETSTIISQVISESAPKLLEDYQLQLTTALNEKVIELANEKIDGMKLNDILALINKYQ